MKTTLNLDDGLAAEAKAFAAHQRTSLTRLIEEGLRLRLQPRAEGTRQPFVTPVLEGRGGMVAGIDPSSNRSLRAALGDDA